GQVLSIHAGSIPLEACLALFEGEAKEAFRALSALTSAGVLTGSPQGYRFTHSSLRELLLAELEDARRRRAHIRFGELLLEREPLSPQDAVAAGVHLLRRGEPARGGKLVVRAATDTAPTDLQRSIARLFEEALTLFRGAGRTSYEQIGLLARLSIAGYYADRSLAFRYGEETLGLFAQLFHLSTAL